MERWMIEAIEREADKRAGQRIARGEVEFIFCGLCPKQLHALIAFYEHQTGRDANRILDEEQVRS